jgi:hypothetical protein
MTKTVYIVPCRKAYHTNPDCQHLDEAKSVKESPAESVTHYRTHCSRCAGTSQYSGGQTRPSTDRTVATPPDDARAESNVHIGHVWTTDGFSKV